MAFFNQHSFTLIGLASALILSILLFRDGAQQSDFIALGALILGFVIAFMLLRPGESTTDDATEVAAQIGKELPVLLEFQSNY
jgi:hypothetical protein